MTEMERLLQVIQNIDAENKNLLVNPVVELKRDDEEEHKGSDLFRELVERKTLEEHTNFSQFEILNLWHKVEPKIGAHRRRGPRPKVSYLDSMIILLIFYKSALDFDHIAAFINKKSNTIVNAINRIRPLVLEALTESWWSQRRRPVPVPESDYPHIGLLIDSTSLQVFRPKGRFEEAIAYYDGKNKMYALKKEVAVMATEPHFALFSSDGFVGSKHDYSYFVENYAVYLDYLKKTTEEKRALLNDRHAFWSVCQDKGYIGPAEDTREIRRIIPRKNVRSIEDSSFNNYISGLRGNVERFFGRLKMLWKISKVCLDVFYFN